jgi:anti-sigma regulatory factor (Ser/Thr protein kinase)
MVRDLRLDDGRLRLTLANDLGEIAAALPHLQAFGEAAGLGPKLQNRLEVVFEELVSNAIRHGSAQTVQVCAEAEGEGLTLVIEDDGAPFNPLDQPEPAALTHIATAPVGGLGIALVAKLATRLDYEAPEPGEGPFRPANRVTVVLAR